jgi:hypothetical protein
MAATIAATGRTATRPWNIVSTVTIGCTATRSMLAVFKGPILRPRSGAAAATGESPRDRGHPPPSASDRNGRTPFNTPCTAAGARNPANEYPSDRRRCRFILPPIANCAEFPPLSSAERPLSATLSRAMIASDHPLDPLKTQKEFPRACGQRGPGNIATRERAGWTTSARVANGPSGSLDHLGGRTLSMNASGESLSCFHSAASAIQYSASFSQCSASFLASVARSRDMISNFSNWLFGFMGSSRSLLSLTCL